MNKKLYWLGISGLFALGIMSYAYALSDKEITVKAPSVSFNVRVVDMHALLSGSKEVSSMAEQYRKDFAPRQNEIKKQKQKLDADNARLKAEQSTLRATEKDKLKHKIDEEESQLKSLQMRLQRDFFKAQNKLNEAMAKIYPHYQEEIVKMAKQQHVDLVLDKGGSVRYFSSQYDMTKAVEEAVKSRK